MSASELKIIALRRNFLIRALGFTAAGAVLPISIITADDAQARIAPSGRVGEGVAGLLRREPHNVRIVHQASPARLVVEEEGFQPPLATSIFMICAGGNDVS